MPGAQRVGSLLTGVAYDRDEGADFMVPLDAGRSTSSATRRIPTVARLSLYLWSPEGKRLVTQRGGPPQGVLTHCAAESGPFRLEAKVATGAGHFVVVPYGLPASPAAPAPTPPGPAR